MHGQKPRQITTGVMDGQKQRQRHNHKIQRLDHEIIAWAAAKTKTLPQQNYMDRSKYKDMTTRILHGQKQIQRHDHKHIAWTEAKTKT